MAKPPEITGHSKSSSESVFDNAAAIHSFPVTPDVTAHFNSYDGTFTPTLIAGVRVIEQARKVFERLRGIRVHGVKSAVLQLMVLPNTDITFSTAPNGEVTVSAPYADEKTTIHFETRNPENSESTPLSNDDLPNQLPNDKSYLLYGPEFDLIKHNSIRISGNMLHIIGEAEFPENTFGDQPISPELLVEAGGQMGVAAFRSQFPQFGPLVSTVSQQFPSMAFDRHTPLTFDLQCDLTSFNAKKLRGDFIINGSVYAADKTNPISTFSIKAAGGKTPVLKRTIGILMSKINDSNGS